MAAVDRRKETVNRKAEDAREFVELLAQLTEEKKAAQLGKGLYAKSAGSRSGSRHAAYSEKSEVQEGTAMEAAWDSEAKHQTSHWRSANGVLRAHLTSGKNSSKDIRKRTVEEGRTET